MPHRSGIDLKSCFPIGTSSAKFVMQNDEYARTLRPDFSHQKVSKKKIKIFRPFPLRKVTRPRVISGNRIFGRTEV